MSSELTEEGIPAPIGAFILDNAKGMQLFDGRYYHYSEVCALLKLYGERVLEKAAENAHMVYHDGFTKEDKSTKYFQSGADHVTINKKSITDPKNLEV